MASDAGVINLNNKKNHVELHLLNTTLPHQNPICFRRLIAKNGAIHNLL